MMTNDQFAGIIRALVAAAGGYFVGQGYVSAEMATTIGGAVVTLAVAAWSVWAKRTAA